MAASPLPFTQKVLDPSRPRGQRVQALQRLGFLDSEVALRNLEELQQRFSQTPAPRWPQLLEEIRHTPDPDGVLRLLDRFMTIPQNPGILWEALWASSHARTRLLQIFAHSHSLSRRVMEDPLPSLHRLSDPSLLAPPSPRPVLIQRALDTVGDLEDPGAFPRIRLFRQWEYIRILLRDVVGGVDLEETTEELSHLADACLEVAWKRAWQRLTARWGVPTAHVPGWEHPVPFTILGMGKLGGEELNYSSDIDILFVYGTERGETTGVGGGQGPTLRLSNHEFFVRASREVIQFLSTVTPEGWVFRVDTRLRPEGEKGDLASSLRSYEIYYESWGRPWERAALLKVRPVAGDRRLGRAFVDMIQPFVYRKYLDYEALEEIRNLKARIEEAQSLRSGEGLNVKTGPGGIREVEFFVQALQLVYGGREPWIRERNTLRALHRLVQKGILSFPDAEALSRAYRFLRSLEHRIQILEERQTHRLPTNLRERYLLARRMGYPPGDPQEVVDRFLRDYAYHTGEVRSRFEALLHQPASRVQVPESPVARTLRPLLEGITEEAEAIRLLSRYPFQDPRKVYRSLVLLRDGPPLGHQPSWVQGAFVAFFPYFFQAALHSPDPDQAIHLLGDLVQAYGSPHAFYAFFLEHPQAVTPLVELLGSSTYLARVLIQHPELVEMLVDPTQALERKGYRPLQRDLRRLLQGAREEDFLNALRRFKASEELRIGWMDLRGILSLPQVMTCLSAVAEVCVEAAYGYAWAKAQRQYGIPLEADTGKRARGMVVGVGKLGSREMVYGSDLDLFVVYSRQGTTTKGCSNQEFFSHLGAHLIHALSATTREGVAWRVDTRLRPTGEKGPLAQSQEAVLDHLAHHAEIWEYQVLTRARILAGDRRLGKAFLSHCHQHIYHHGASQDLARAIRTMRERMEAERSREDARCLDLKLGPGGIVDVEFLTQFLQLRYGASHPSVRRPHTLQALQALRREGILPSRDYRTLMRAWRFLRLLESRIRMTTHLPLQTLPRDPGRLRPLALRMGFSDTPRRRAEVRLLQTLERIRRGVRTCFLRWLSSPSGHPQSSGPFQGREIL